MGIFNKKNKSKNDFFNLLESDVLSEYGKSDKKDYTNNLSPNIITADELKGEAKENGEGSSLFSSELTPLESLKMRMKHQSISSHGNGEENSHINSDIREFGKEESVEGRSTDNKTADSLLERCRAYTTDERGKDLSGSEEKLYNLESVAEILKSDSQRAIENLSKKYDVRVDELSLSYKSDNSEAPDYTEAVTEQISSQKQKSGLKKSNNDSAADLPENDYDISSILGIIKESSDIPDISDIDNIQKREEPEIPEAADTATIKFTPVRDSVDGESRMSVSSITKVIDISEDLKSITPDGEPRPTETELEETEFEEFKIKDEYTSEESGKALVKKLSINKRSSFISVVFSAVFSLVVLAFSFAPAADLLITKPRTAAIVCTAVFAANIAVSFKMFKGLSAALSKRCRADAIASLTALFALSLALMQIKTASPTYSKDTYFILLCSSIMLFTRNLSAFWQISSTLGNLKQITVKRPKKAIDLITDSATTFAMAKNSIEGDVLVATPRKADFISNFMKYSKFGSLLNGKMPVLAIFSIILSIILGISAGMYRSSPVFGFYTASAVMCIAAAIPLFMIDNLPLYGAAKRLNKKGAMIAGIAAAERIEMANAAVISTTDIFPDETVTLQNIKVLSDNNIDDTLIRAAALTEAVGSPLTPIFKRIAKTNNSYAIPDSDDVKYEDRLGLSGWVGDLMLFVGNRTLLESHGIAVPDIEIDKKILRKGFFPVYIACEGKACALAVIQYNVQPDIARELRKITELGVTLLVCNHDPNINEEMICDYFGLYDDSVKIMSNAGIHMYKNAVVPAVRCSAPAAFRSGPMTFITIMNSASRIKRANTALSILYIICCIAGFVSLAYMTFSGSDSITGGLSVLIFQLITALLSAAAYLINKP